MSNYFHFFRRQLIRKMVLLAAPAKGTINQLFFILLLAILISFLTIPDFFLLEDRLYFEINQYINFCTYFALKKKKK